MKIFILYGSETGTAQFEACQLAMKFLREDLEICYSTLDDFDFTQLIDIRFLIVLVSTTGVGDFPQNSKLFWEKLSIQYSNDILQNLEYTVFGFGDRTYANFNTAAKLIDIRLNQLSGQRFIDSRFGDAQHENGYLQEYTIWKNDLFEYFDFQIEKQYEFLFKLIQCDEQQNKHQQIFQDLNLESFQIQQQIQLSSQDHFQKINKLSLKCNKKYQICSGDCISIKYKNNKKQIEKLIQYIQPIQKVKFVKNNVYKDIDFVLHNKIYDIKFLLEEIFDVLRPPFYQILKFLSKFTDQQIYKEKLQQMTFEDYNDYVVIHKRNLIEIFEDFKINNVPLELILNFTPLITNRLYSISNYNNDNIDIIYNVVQYNTSQLRKVKGLCTNYLDKLSTQDNVYAQIQKGPFNYTQKNGKFLVISTGTGIAPFLLFLRQKYTEIDEKNVVFLFGCRNKQHDFIEEEFLNMLQEEHKINLKVAFSRDQKEKFYVQHIIQKEQKFFIQFLQNDIDKLNIFVCGNSKFLIQSIEKQVKKRTRKNILQYIP